MASNNNQRMWIFGGVGVLVLAAVAVWQMSGSHPAVADSAAPKAGAHAGSGQPADTASSTASARDAAKQGAGDASGRMTASPGQEDEAGNKDVPPAARVAKHRERPSGRNRDAEPAREEEEQQPAAKVKKAEPKKPF